MENCGGEGMYLLQPPAMSATLPRAKGKAERVRLLPEGKQPKNRSTAHNRNRSESPTPLRLALSLHQQCRKAKVLEFLGQPTGCDS
jgi:hypothetical protein